MLTKKGAAANHGDGIRREKKSERNAASIRLNETFFFQAVRGVRKNNFSIRWDVRSNEIQVIRKFKGVEITADYIFFRYTFGEKKHLDCTSDDESSDAPFFASPPFCNFINLNIYFGERHIKKRAIFCIAPF